MKLVKPTVPVLAMTALFGAATPLVGQAEEQWLSSGGATQNSRPAPLIINRPVQPPPDLRLSAGTDQTCADLDSGKIKCWGWNQYGQLGDGNGSAGAQSTTPVEVVDMTDAAALGESRYHHNCALLESGQAKCWGEFSYGKLGGGSATYSATPVEVSVITDAIAISAGGNHTCAVLPSGKVNCWGYNVWGQLGDGTTTDNVNAVEVSGITNAVDVDVGSNHSCALLDSGKVNCWGSNFDGQMGDGAGWVSYRTTPVEVSGITNAVELDLGSFNSCAVLETGKINCWGRNGNGQLGDGTTTERSSPVEVVGITDPVDFSQGGLTACAVMASGKINCWGRNDTGQIGDGTTTDRLTPVEVSGITDAIHVNMGPWHGCAALASGQAMCWGENDYGKLGDGTETNRLTPVEVQGLYD